MYNLDLRIREEANNAELKLIVKKSDDSEVELCRVQGLGSKPYDSFCSVHYHLKEGEQAFVEGSVDGSVYGVKTFYQAAFLYKV